MKPLAGWLLACALLLVGNAAQAGLQLQLKTDGLSPAEQRATQALLDEAIAHLPPSFIERLDRRVEMSWSTRMPDNAYGEASLVSEVELNRNLLPGLVDGSAATRKTNRPHGTVREEMLATVLHELTHIYDRARLWPDWPDAERTLIQRCSRQSDNTGLVGLPDQCRGQTHRRFTLSDDPRLLDLAGWQQSVGTRGQREEHNKQIARSPDIYETTNPKEFVAVNMEYFLLDPAYACRRPALYRYYQERFGWAPPKKDTCATAFPSLQPSRSSTPATTSARRPWARSTPSESTKSTICWPKPTRTGSAAGATACCAWSSARPAGHAGRTVGWTWTSTWCCPTAPSSTTCNSRPGAA